tara:strand:- start:107 stop:376 length:270 start_codon:yes stop_codon:yes gene_type:complete
LVRVIQGPIPASTQQQLQGEAGDRPETLLDLLEAPGEGGEDQLEMLEAVVQGLPGRVTPEEQVALEKEAAGGEVRDPLVQVHRGMVVLV